MKIMLDTSAYVAFKRDDQATVATITKAESIMLSAVVLGELLFGFRNGTRFVANVTDLKRFIDHEAVAFVPIIQFLCATKECPTEKSVKSVSNPTSPCP